MQTVSLDPDFLSELFPRHEVDSGFRDQLISILQHDPEFPTFPSAIAKLQGILNHPNTGLPEISEIVRLDPALTARLLSLGRAAAFGAADIASVEEALLRIGLNETRNAILTSKFTSCFSRLKIKVDWSKFWLHSLFAARLTDKITTLFRQHSEKEYLTGLLHGSGKLVLAHYFPEKFEAILQNCRLNATPMYEAEQRLLGTDHAVIGAALCHRWGLDHEILNAIRFQHEPQKSTSDQLLPRCLHVAHTIANQWVDSFHFQKSDSPPESVTEVEEWAILSGFKPLKVPNIKIERERDRAAESVSALQLGA